LFFEQVFLFAHRSGSSIWLRQLAALWSQEKIIKEGMAVEITAIGKGLIFRSLLRLPGNG